MTAFRFDGHSVPLAAISAFMLARPAGPNPPLGCTYAQTPGEQSSCSSSMRILQILGSQIRLEGHRGEGIGQSPHR